MPGLNCNFTLVIIFVKFNVNFVSLSFEFPITLLSLHKRNCYIELIYDNISQNKEKRYSFFLMKCIV